MSNYIIRNGQLYDCNELYHYGVKGMKWGVRKKYPESDIAANVRRTKTEYKHAKAVRKDAINSTATKLNRESSFGDRLIYNNATRRKAAKYIVDHNMSVSEATKRSQTEALRNTAVFMSLYGAIALGTLLKNSK